MENKCCVCQKEFKEGEKRYIIYKGNDPDGRFVCSQECFDKFKMSYHFTIRLPEK